MDRRTFIKIGAAALAAPALVTSRALADTPKLGKIAYQLGWVKNFQFAGEYIADANKYFEQEGIAVDLLAGGPSVSAEPIVISGKALVGQNSTDNTANAVAKGAPLKIIGTNYQKSPSSIISLTKTGLKAPKDLVGKTVGIQANNQVVWNAFLKINGIDPASVNTVPAQHDFTPLVSGELDAFFGFSNDDVVQLRQKGQDVSYLLMADYGYPMFNCNYLVTEETLKDKEKRAQVVAFMRGAIRGWQEAVKNPALSAQLTVDVYGKGNGLDQAAQEKSAAATNELMVTPDTEKHGLFWMTDKAVDETIATLATAGIVAKKDLFTNEILEEAFQGKTTL
ncbi:MULTISPECIES: ABC transporter substrate-binding protein [Kaistia]|uniref:Thiamine pyrimidine synthase n=1 Tax=Kaistia nematophila TaxID=2994654 RepID=A0A9X3E283_9HYPH|nr:ABC transporter substrate-binding protein [Kaistia nematophila]MBN9026856.1 ABC transporter substrate-binding protein [Hyphomicrobiales bacterium]MCX5570059.1 ABC transporter substrate-binding protein [Kaistia nematophila]